MKNEKICGIYCISNSKYFYIGHSKDIYSRWDKHRSLLRKSQHVNCILQNVYNKYYELDPFKYEIILECSIQDLQRNEGEKLLEYVYKFPEKKCMNIANPISELKHFTRINGKLVNISEELAEPLMRNEIITTKRGKAPWKYKKIVQLDKEGNLIKIWDTTKIAEQSLNIHIHLEKHTCGGFLWQRYDEWIERPKGKVNHIHNIDDTIKLFSLDGKFIREFKNSSEVKKVYNDISLSSLNACLNKKQKSCYNFLWSYNFKAPRYKSVGNVHNTGKRVYKSNLDGEIINIYPSIALAAKSIKVSPTTLKNYINNNKIYKGFIWSIKK